jgi:shikimate dehydrogenase
MTPTKIYGLAGYPVKHSLSPAMHNAAFHVLQLNAKYVLFEKKPDELVGFMRNLAHEHVCGLNITIPHKETILPFLSEVTEEAKLIGAVNTVRIEGDRTIGHNTDGLGFLKHLMDIYHKSLYGQTVAVLGAGGAARAITQALAAEGVSKIRIFDIQAEKAEAIVDRIIYNFEVFDIEAVASVEALFETQPDLLINATPVGMYENDPLLIPEARLKPSTFVYDVIYKPSETKLLQLARNKGCAFTNGLGMLLHQGVLSFEFWTQLKAPVEIMRQALYAALL